MLEILGRRPARVGGVAGSAISREIGRYVVGVSSALEIRLVAGDTGVRGIGIIAAQVAFGAVGYVVPFGQREEIMLNLVGAPAWIREVVAFRALRRKACLPVVGFAGCIKVFQVAINAVVSNPVELQGGGRSMTLCAIQAFVHAR